jgi:hypothetical protein
VDDGKVLMSEWGFGLADVGFECVRFYYGSNGGELEECGLERVWGETHMSLDHVKL